ncbi:VanZ family protein [Aquimarina sp. ERC-38]|uniref:VanZ family protein n=1 Tax=Aquimarina sp. ERC-38 TaxID=2949996 RepID=UPI002247A6B5|nr:VanZ family protein [Aquimarina sp. ERC-38]UZO81206.1 VanZ family protein [Aquimarina sp. ERC-38]
MHIRNWLVRNLVIFGAVAYSALICYLSIGRISVPDQIHFNYSDKIGHFLAYFGLTVVWFTCFFVLYKKSNNQSLVFAIFFSVIFGILMEVLQSWLTDYRTADWFDIMANTIGALLAGIAIKYNLKYIEQIKNRWW